MDYEAEYAWDRLCEYNAERAYRDNCPDDYDEEDEIIGRCEWCGERIYAYEKHLDSGLSMICGYCIEESYHPAKDKILMD